MDNNFFTYVDRMELLAFFSGYPLVYSMIIWIGGNVPSKMGIRSRMPSWLPYSYALVGTLYLGLQLRSLFPDYSFVHIRQSFQQPNLKIFGLLSLVFWIPAISRKKVWSLMHSLVFFFLWVKDLSYQQLLETSYDGHPARNSMIIYTVSLIVNLGTLAVITILLGLFGRFRHR